MPDLPTLVSTAALRCAMPTPDQAPHCTLLPATKSWQQTGAVGLTLQQGIMQWPKPSLQTTGGGPMNTCLQCRAAALPLTSSLVRCWQLRSWPGPENQ